MPRKLLVSRRRVPGVLRPKVVHKKWQNFFCQGKTIISNGVTMETDIGIKLWLDTDFAFRSGDLGTGVVEEILYLCLYGLWNLQQSVVDI